MNVRTSDKPAWTLATFVQTIRQMQKPHGPEHELKYLLAQIDSQVMADAYARKSESKVVLRLNYFILKVDDLVAVLQRHVEENELKWKGHRWTNCDLTVHLKL